MEKEHKDFIKGSDMEKIKVFETIKGIFIDLFRGYPIYGSFGIIEGRFGDQELGKRVRDKLDKDGFREVDRTQKPELYRLSAKGVDLAISMFNLNYSQEIQKLNKNYLV